jgi:uncharacterized protein YjiS (DUF1127 family)
MSKSFGYGISNTSTTTRPAKQQPVLYSLIEMIGAWAARWHQRKVLAELDEHFLNDVGLSPEQTRREAAKPFWKR